MTATIYTTQSCGYCPMVKRWLDYKKVPYHEIDITETPPDLPHDIKGILTVPITILNGHTVVGYNLQNLTKALTS